MNLTKNDKIKYYIFLHLIIFLYSVAGVFSKMSARYEFMSFGFILFYGLVLIVLLFYAFLWQKILKVFPLLNAYSNKAAAILWGLLFGGIVFDEPIKLNMIAGVLIVAAGVVLVVRADES